MADLSATLQQINSPLREGQRTEVRPLLPLRHQHSRPLGLAPHQCSPAQGPCYSSEDSRELSELTGWSGSSSQRKPPCATPPGCIRPVSSSSNLVLSKR